MTLPPVRLRLGVSHWLPLLAGILVTAGCEARRAARDPADSSAPTVALHPELRITGAIGDTGAFADIRSVAVDSAGVIYVSPDAVEFGSIIGLAVDASGTTYVADAGRQHIVVLRSDGSLRGLIGGPGEGPGEFRSISTVHLLPGDSLLVYDIQLSRATVFDPSTLQVVRTVGIAASGGGVPAMLVPGPGGGLVAAYERPYVAGRPDPGDQRRETTIRLLGPDGQVREDSVVSFPGSPALVWRSGSAVAVRGHPFGRETFFGVLDDRLVYLTSDARALHLLPLESGAPASSIALPHLRVPLDRRTVRETALALPEQFRAPLLAAVPEAWPTYTGLTVSEDEHVWLEISLEPGRRRRWERWSAAGGADQAVNVPWSLHLLAVRNGRFYAVFTDADDVQRLAVLSPSAAAERR